MSATQSAETTQTIPNKSNGKGKHRKRRTPAEMAAAKVVPPAQIDHKAREAALRTAPTVKPPQTKAAPNHLLVQGLFESFPQMADIEAAKDWLDTASAVLKMTCRFPGSLTVTAQAA